MCFRRRLIVPVVSQRVNVKLFLLKRFSCGSGALLLLALMGNGLLAQNPNSMKERVDALAQPYIDSGTVVGMTIGIIHEGRQEFFGYGVLDKDVAEDSQTIPDADTVYEIGSVSKLFTSLLLADAVVGGELKLDQAARELLPDGGTMPAFRDGGAITLKQLATHSSGLPRLPSNLEMTDPENPYATYTDKALFEFLNQHSLKRAPGSHYGYSNLGAGLLGNLLAKHAKSSYEELLKSKITTRLGMASTSIALTPSQQSRLAKPYTEAGIATKNWDLPALAGAGAIRSTAADMIKFADAQLNRPEGELGEAIQLAWKKHEKSLEPGQIQMGLGWHVAGDRSTRWHNGQTGGYHSGLFVSRKEKCAAVLLCNSSSGEAGVLAEQVMRMLAGASEKPRVFAKLLEVPQEVLQRYVGRYELAPGVIFTVTTQDDKLMVGLTGQSTHRVYPRSETEWFYKVVDATLVFDVDDDGVCQSVMLLQNGLENEAKRIVEPAADE